MAEAKTSTGKAGDGRKIVAENRKARHDYDILETFEAGMSLVGTEVKSLRAGSCTLSDAYVRIDDGEAWIVGMHIPPYVQGNIHNHEPDRSRRLLLHRREIEQIHTHITRKGNTAVPLSVYFSNGRAKLALAVGKGRDKGDKRRAIADRDVKRQIDRQMKGLRE
jgi:SsrA-binding protein